MRIDPKKWVPANLKGVRERGKSFETDCPFCGKAGHFYVHRERGYYSCFAKDCGAAGRSIIALIARVEGVSISEIHERLFREEIKFAPPRSADQSGIRARLNELRKEAAVLPRVEVGPPASTVPVWNGKTWRMPRYLTERSITRRVAHRYGIGFCNRNLCARAPMACDFAKGKKTCVEIGQCRYANRIILPFDCPNGRSFTARSVDADAEPKYLNPVAPKGRLLYGWCGVRPESEIVLVEGPFDALKLAVHGIPALALMGISMTQTQLSLIAALRPAEVVVMLDAGVENEAIKIASNLLGATKSVYLARLEGAKDPGDSTRDQALAAVHGAERFVGSRARTASAILRRVSRQRKNLLLNRNTGVIIADC